MIPIPQIDALTPEIFRNEVLPLGLPVVARGLVRDWPVVRAAQTSDEAFCDYIRRFDRGYGVDTFYGPPSIGGRIFYNNDLSGLNARVEQTRLSTALDYLLEHLDDDPAPTIAIQSVVISRHLPGLETENPLLPGLVPDAGDQRLWIGGRATIAAHFDSSENIACCVAGTRQFTLFPPEQVANLYIGPFEVTPAGATISMVDFDNPDYEAYPRFREAEQAAMVANLAPGDAVYVPYLWWHHVRSLGSINGLINTWWAQPEKERGDPRNALLHAMMSIRSLPASQRKAWRSMFDHYVFGEGVDAASHLPATKRGILGDMRPDAVKKLRAALARALSRS